MVQAFLSGLSSCLEQHNCSTPPGESSLEFDPPIPDDEKITVAKKKVNAWRLLVKTVGDGGADLD